MKKVKISGVVAALLLAGFVSVLNSSMASAEWKQDSNGWWNTEGISWTVGWKQLDGKWYYFGQDGYMVHDTIIDGYTIGSDGAWIENKQINPPPIKKDYDCSEDAYNKGWRRGTNGSWWNKEKSFIRGWQLIEGKYYFFNEDGAMKHDTFVDGYKLGGDGAWDKTQVKLQDITMKTEKNVYPIGTKEVKAYITNNTNLEIYTGTPYMIEKFENNEWNSLAFKSGQAWEDVVIKLPLVRVTDDNFKLSTLKDFKSLIPGKYRIVKELTTSQGCTHVTAEFELQ